MAGQIKVSSQTRTCEESSFRRPFQKYTKRNASDLRRGINILIIKSEERETNGGA